MAESVGGDRGPVYDFLYYDVGRIGSFLGQFDPDGLLQARKKLASIAKESGSASTVEATAGIPAVLGSKGNVTNSAGDKYGKSAEHTYDPLWANALSFLDYIEQHELVVRIAEKASIGQFVLIEGSLTILDMSLWKAMIENGVIKKFLEHSLGVGKTAAGPRQKNAPPNEAELAMAVMPLLPHLIQAIIDSGTQSFWSALLPERLSLSTGDLMLKHGPMIEGKWSVLGILDALPDSDRNLGSSLGVTELSGVIAQFSTVIRPVFGRPSTSYGITPLMIFREVSSISE